MTREAWTDERLDDLAKRVDTGFSEVKGEIRDLRSEVSGMQRTMVIGFVTLFASIFASVVGAVLGVLTLA